MLHMGFVHGCCAWFLCMMIYSCMLCMHDTGHPHCMPFASNKDRSPYLFQFCSSLIYFSLFAVHATYSKQERMMMLFSLWREEEDSVTAKNLKQAESPVCFSQT